MMDPIAICWKCAKLLHFQYFQISVQRIAFYYTLYTIYRRWTSANCHFGNFIYACRYTYMYFLPLVLVCQFRSSSDGLQPSLGVSTLYHVFQLVVQQSWSILFLMDSHFQHRSSRLCHIQHDYLSVASLCLPIAFLYALPDGLFLVSSFHIDCAWNLQRVTAQMRSASWTARRLTLRLVLDQFPQCQGKLPIQTHSEFPVISSVQQ